MFGYGEFFKCVGYTEIFAGKFWISSITKFGYSGNEGKCRIIYLFIMLNTLSGCSSSLFFHNGG